MLRVNRGKDRFSRWFCQRQEIGRKRQSRIKEKAHENDQKNNGGHRPFGVFRRSSVPLLSVRRPGRKKTLADR